MRGKKILAVLMTATMVMAMSMTAFAADGDASGNGSADGTGASEGHVEQKHMNVVLPTATAQTFAYTMDPERLIQTTSGGKYAEGTTFPAADGDTGVYFLTGEKTYANESNELQIVNKSSHDIKVDVKVKTTASEGGKDIELATEELEDDETAPKLYLAAVVGEGTGASTQILSATEKTVAKKLAGNASNYEIIVQENEETNAKEYVYKQKTTGLTDWTALKFKIKGAVSNAAIASDTTAPKITVTWNFAEPGQSDTELSTDGVGTYSDMQTINAAVFKLLDDGSAYFKLLADSSGVTADKITSVKVNGADKEFELMSNGVLHIADVVEDDVDTYNGAVIYDGALYVKSVTKE